ncbi:MAG: UDP-N-acetylglucosamine 2-epimerase (non-hydrolyzing) [Euryarchaeota archaeon]|nr:UDP-N-acetylglucosamine 2-epimerase (non-hydrolyzing) [Euryarchaeota archaeon]
MGDRESVAIVLGTRPEIIKLSSLIPLLDEICKLTVIHTGQHYDFEMDGVFFDELNLRRPDYQLKVGSLGALEQITKITLGVRKTLPSDVQLVIVQGDTNTTLGGALAASKMKIPVAHVEAGCRSFNRAMPEEVNRILVDHISSLLFAPDMDSRKHLLDEGIDRQNIFVVGDTVVDACKRMSMHVSAQDFKREFGIDSERYALATIHRAETTDCLERLRNVAASLNLVSEMIDIVLPLHPRTRKALETHRIRLGKRVHILNPIGYRNFIAALKGATMVFTDSGGVQKEAGILNVPCLILRDETEWMDMVKRGKNIIVGTKPNRVTKIVRTLLEDKTRLERMKKQPSGLKSGASKNIVNILIGKKLE